MGPATPQEGSELSRPFCRGLRLEKKLRCLPSYLSSFRRSHFLLISRPWVWWGGKRGDDEATWKKKGPWDADAPPAWLLLSTLREPALTWASERSLVSPAVWGPWSPFSLGLLLPLLTGEGWGLEMGLQSPDLRPCWPEAALCGPLGALPGRTGCCCWRHTTPGRLWLCIPTCQESKRETFTKVLATLAPHLYIYYLSYSSQPPLELRFLFLFYRRKNWGSENQGQAARKLMIERGLQPRCVCVWQNLFCFPKSQRLT